MISQWPWSETFGIINRKKLGHILIDILSKKQFKLESLVWNKAVWTVAPVVFWKVGQFEIFRNFSITGSDNNTQSVWDRAVRGRPLQEVPGHTPEHDGQSRLGRWRRSVQHLLRSQVSWGSQAREPDEKGRVTCFRSSISHDNASLLSMELADIDEVLLIMISVEEIFIGTKIIIFAQ